MRMPDGKYEEWFEDGATKSQGEYAGGRETGAMDVVAPIARPQAGRAATQNRRTTLWPPRTFTVRGELEGKQLLYHENGQKQLEVIYHGGRREGPWTEWYDSGAGARCRGVLSRPDCTAKLLTGSKMAVRGPSTIIFAASRSGHWVEWDRTARSSTIRPTESRAQEIRAQDAAQRCIAETADSRHYLPPLNFCGRV